MSKLRLTLTLLLALILSVPGFSVPAEQPCTGRGGEMQGMDISAASIDEGCKDCDKQGPAKQPCCDYPACSFNCSASASVICVNAVAEAWQPLFDGTQTFLVTDTRLSSRSPPLQDRPPKQLL